MATRSTISYLDSPNRVRTIYVHWDGYISGVGAILVNHYRDPALIEQLIRKGDISSLRPTVDETAFYRDRGETGVEAVPSTLDRFLTPGGGHDSQEYNYLWANGDWTVYTQGEWHVLEPLVKSKITDIIDFISK